MKPPSKITVGSYTYDVVITENAINRAQVERKENLYGCHNPSRQEIALHPDQKPDCMADTTLHEVLHACLWHSGAQLEDDVEEQAVSAIASVLLDALRRNPELVKYLTDDH